MWKVLEYHGSPQRVFSFGRSLDVGSPDFIAFIQTSEALSRGCIVGTRMSRTLEERPLEAALLMPPVAPPPGRCHSSVQRVWDGSLIQSGPSQWARQSLKVGRLLSPCFSRHHTFFFPPFGIDTSRWRQSCVALIAILSTAPNSPCTQTSVYVYIYLIIYCLFIFHPF